MTTRRPGPGVGLSVGLMGAGFVLGVVGVVFFVLTLVKTVLAPAHDIPGQFQLELGKGEWTIYQHTGREIRSATDTSPAQQESIEYPRLSTENITISSASAVVSPLPRPTSANETITQGTAVYTAVMKFDVETAGRYDVQVSTSGRGKVLIARGFADTFVRAARWIALMFAGGLLFLLGGILLIVGIVKRRNAAPPTAPPPYVPPPATPPTSPPPAPTTG